MITNFFYFSTMENLVKICVLLVMLTVVTADADVDDDGYSMDANTIVVNAVGRTFTLGMLYDRRSDQIIPGK